MEKQFEVMLANKGSVDNLDSGMWAQYKFDGCRYITLKDGDNITMVSRSWKSEFQNDYPDIVEYIKSLPYDSIILDGELTFIDATGRDVFMSAHTTREVYETKGLRPIYNVFDIIMLDDVYISELPLCQRDALLRTIIAAPSQHVRVPGYCTENQKEYFAELVAIGAEGLVLKDPTAPYFFGRCSSWLKIKKLYGENADTVDAWILGYCNGKGRLTGTLGAVIMAEKMPNGIDWHYIAKASGISDDERAALKTMLDGIQTTPYEMYNWDGSKSTRKVDVWVQPIHMAEIRYQGRTDANKLRFPTFLRLRDDLE